MRIRVRYKAENISHSNIQIKNGKIIYVNSRTDIYTHFWLGYRKFYFGKI